MNWRERMDVHVDRDDIDEKALEKFNEWVSMAEGDFTREDCILKGYDPEILNEFCFYPLKYWGRLIEWATEEEEDPYEPSYQYKIIRASYLLTKVDPSIIQFTEHESRIDPNHNGPVFVKQYEEVEISPESKMLMRKLNGMESWLNQLNALDEGWNFSDEEMAEMNDILADMENEMKML